MARLAAFAVANFDYVEDHIRPVVRRYIPGPVQKKSELRGGGLGWGWLGGAWLSFLLACALT